MNSVNESSEVLISSNLNDCNNSKCCTEFSSATDIVQEDEVGENLNKSELDIEIEMCEELLNSEYTEGDYIESLNFDKENLSELSDSDSVSPVLENYSRKKPKLEVLKSRNVGKCEFFLSYEVASKNEAQNDVNITLISKNCLQTSNKLNEIIDNVLGDEGQLPDIAPDLSLSDSKSMHTTIFDSLISKCKDQLKHPLQKDAQIILQTPAAVNHLCKESNEPAKFIFIESENKGVNVLSVLSKSEDSCVILECQNVGQCQNIKCEEINETPNGESITLLSKDCPETSSELNKIFNDNASNNERVLSDNEPDSTISVLEKQYPLNLDIEISRCNGEIKSPLENYEANTLRDQDLKNCDIKNNAPIKLAFNDQSSDIVPDLTLPVLPNPYSTNLVCDVSKSNSQMKCPMENNEPSTLNEHGFVNDEEKDDDELSLYAETDVSTIEEFEMSILDVTDNDEQFTTNNSDEILLSSVKEDDDETVSSIIEKVPAKSCTEQIKAKRVDLLDTDNNDEIKLRSIEKEESKETASDIIVKNPMKPTSEEIKAAEKDDLFDSRWDTIKQLSSDEDRYQQVKNCWKCATVPDPNKNLTYHSFRKRHFKDTKISRPQQRKRMASNNLNEHSAKRSRSCTYHLDHQIETVSAKEKQETEKIKQEMNIEICRVNRSFEQEAQRQYNSYAFGQLQANLENKIASIRSQYRQQTNHCIAKVESEIHALNVARNEVLQFYKFYKGLNSRNDPTVLTFEQNLELEEIENIYSKFDQLYK